MTAASASATAATASAHVRAVSSFEQAGVAGWCGSSLMLARAGELRAALGSASAMGCRSAAGSAAAARLCWKVSWRQVPGVTCCRCCRLGAGGAASNSREGIMRLRGVWTIVSLHGESSAHSSAKGVEGRHCIARLLQGTG
jgi:hypothetical protein